MELGRMPWTAVEAPIVIVPVGACEQHGPHLPLHTDTVVAEALAHELAARRPNCVVAPSITISASGEHAGFPGTLSIGTDVLSSVLVELARSADWASGVVFVNGHGGNSAAMRRAGDVLADEEREVLVWWPRLSDADPHAGRTETSLMLALAPDDVQLDAAVAGPVPPIDDLVRHGVRPLSESGVLGDPAGASAAHGGELFAELATQLADAVDGWIAMGGR